MEKASKLGRVLSCALPLWLALSACDAADGDVTPKDPAGTDTGNPNNGGEGTSNVGGGCDEVGSTDLALDAVTDLGFSAQKLLDLAEGAHAFPIVWKGDARNARGPLNGEQTTLHVEVTRKPGGGVRLVDLEPHMSSSGQEGGLGLLPGQCSDRIEIDVQVTLSTDDGALDESFDTTLTSSDGLGASWSSSPAFSELNGSLTVPLDGAPPGSELGPLTIQMTHTSFVITGSLTASFEGNDGSVAWGGATRLAEWPEEGGCQYEGVPVAPDAKVFDFSLQDALDAVAPLYPTTLTFQDGSPSTQLSFALALREGTGACANLQTGFGPKGLKGQVDLVWSTADGRIDGRLALSLRATPDADGALQAVSLYRDAYLADTVEPGAFEARFGMHGFDLSAYDLAGLQLSWDVDLAQQTAQGSLSVLGGTKPACLTDAPTPVSDGTGGGGTPGCSGINFDEVEQASF